MLEQLVAFWEALDAALDAWVEVNPHFEELVLDSMRGASGEARARGERLLEWARARPVHSVSVCRARDVARRRYFDANHELDAALSPYLDWEAKRACYALRLELIELGHQRMSEAGRHELLPWRETVAQHLERQLEQLRLASVGVMHA